MSRGFPINENKKNPLTENIKFFILMGTQNDLE